MLSKLANFIDFGFLDVYVQSPWNFVFKIRKIVEKLKMDVDRLLLVSKLKKSSNLGIYIEKFVSILKPKVVYVRFHLHYHFPNFENKIVCILEKNM